MSRQREKDLVEGGGGLTVISNLIVFKYKMHELYIGIVYKSIVMNGLFPEKVLKNRVYQIPFSNIYSCSSMH